MLQKIIYCLKAAFKNLNKNLLPNIIACSTIAIAFIVFLTFILLISNFSSFNKIWVEQIQVIVYFKHNTTTTVINQAKETIQNHSEVDSVKFVSAREAFDVLKGSLKGQDGILSGLSSNAFTDSLEIKLKQENASAIAVEAFVQKIKHIKDVVDIQYGQQWLERFLILFDIIKIIGFVSAALLFLFTLFIVSNTIKLLVYNRREEIEIMKLVGATNAFIKLPFYIEGIFQSMSGSACALLFIAFFINLFDDHFIAFARIYLGNFTFTFLTTKITLSVLILGIFLGFIGSTFALQSIDEFNN